MKIQHHHEGTINTGVSFPGWIMHVIDAFRQSTDHCRSHYAAKGAVKQVVMEIRADVFFDLLAKSGRAFDRKNREDVTVSIPKGYMEMIDDHCARCGYDRRNFFDIAIPKFIVFKDSPRSFRQALYDHAGESDAFRTLFN